MSLERDRLLSLIEFSQQSARLRGKPAATVAAHRLFALYEHEIRGLPGIRLNIEGPESEDEIWLAVERLHETRQALWTLPRREERRRAHESAQKRGSGVRPAGCTTEQGKVSDEAGDGSGNNTESRKAC